MRIRLARRILCHGCVLEADPPSRSAPSHHVLQARRSVVRMLIALVLTFAICNLPLHARKMWQHWSPSYRGATPFSAILSPVTFLVTYVNAALDPFLYAFLSANFRRVAKELICGESPRNLDQKKHLAPSPSVWFFRLWKMCTADLQDSIHSTPSTLSWTTLLRVYTC